MKEGKWVTLLTHFHHDAHLVENLQHTKSLSFCEMLENLSYSFSSDCYEVLILGSYFHKYKTIFSVQKILPNQQLRYFLFRLLRKPVWMNGKIEIIMYKHYLIKIKLHYIQSYCFRTWIHTSRSRTFFKYSDSTLIRLVPQCCWIVDSDWPKENHYGLKFVNTWSLPSDMFVKCPTLDFFSYFLV